MMRLEFALALGVAAGATACGLYACVVYNRGLRLKQQKMYLDAFLRAAEVYCNWRLSAPRRAAR